MAALADARFIPGPPPREVWLTFGLSVLFHGLLTVVIVMIPRFQVGTYITVPVTYTVSLESTPPGGPGGGAPPPPPAVLRPPAPLQAPTPPVAKPAPAPAPRPAPAEEELTLPGRRPPRKTAPEREPSLRPRSPISKETARPAPPTPAPAAPAVPQPAPPVASAGAGAGAGKASGAEVAGTASGAASGTGSGVGALASYLAMVDWKIQQNWVPLGAASSPEAIVVVRFTVLRSGQVQVRDIQLETTSGNASLDQSAIRAVRQSLPLPPFPNLLTEPWLDLRYRFVMERG